MYANYGYRSVHATLSPFYKEYRNDVYYDFQQIGKREIILYGGQELLFSQFPFRRLHLNVPTPMPLKRCPAISRFCTCVMLNRSVME